MNRNKAPLAQLRVAKGLTQDDAVLAFEKKGHKVTSLHYLRVERGHVRPSEELVAVAAKVLGVTEKTYWARWKAAYLNTLEENQKRAHAS